MKRERCILRLHSARADAGIIFLTAWDGCCFGRIFATMRQHGVCCHTVERRVPAINRMTNHSSSFLRLCHSPFFHRVGPQGGCMDFPLRRAQTSGIRRSRFRVTEVERLKRPLARCGAYGADPAKHRFTKCSRRAARSSTISSAQSLVMSRVQQHVRQRGCLDRLWRASRVQASSPEASSGHLVG